MSYENLTEAEKRTMLTAYFVSKYIRTVRRTKQLDFWPSELIRNQVEQSYNKEEICRARITEYMLATSLYAIVNAKKKEMK